MCWLINFVLVLFCIDLIFFMINYGKYHDDCCNCSPGKNEVVYTPGYEKRVIWFWKFINGQNPPDDLG